MKTALLLSLFFLTPFSMAQNSLPPGMTRVSSTPRAQTAVTPTASKLCQSIGVNELRDLALAHRKKFASDDIAPEKRGRLPLPDFESITQIQSTLDNPLTGMAPITLEKELDVKGVIIINFLSSPSTSIILKNSKGQKTLVHINEPDTISIPSLNCTVKASPPPAYALSEKQSKSVFARLGDLFSSSSSTQCDPNAKTRTCECTMPQSSTSESATISSKCVDENSVCECGTQEGPQLRRTVFTHILISVCGGEEVTTPIMGTISQSDRPLKREY